MNEKKVREALEQVNQTWPKDSQVISDAVEKVRSALEKALAPEPRFYKGQPVLVKDHDDDEWLHEILVSIGRDPFFPYQTIDAKWKQCKPDPDAPSYINWFEHDGGDCPVDGDEIVFVIYSNGVLQFGGVGVEAKNRYWRNVVRYAIIPLPEFIGGDSC